jgi:alpha-L-rhamnosidase
MHGQIVSDWRIEGKKFVWNVVVPSNATATLYVPAAAGPDGVTEGGRPAGKSEGVRFLRSEGGAAVYQVGSGAYTFVSGPAEKIAPGGDALTGAEEERFLPFFRPE